ncbi:hypothetical protein PMI16_01124 [Herbaspirillum sp. CF444]|jgi:hypothetical protein|nr:hypothetical protein PMI16_01124 [Herbaspirillum sp. CF444]
MADFVKTGTTKTKMGEPGSPIDDDRSLPVKVNPIHQKFSARLSTASAASFVASDNDG